MSPACRAWCAIVVLVLVPSGFRSEVSASDELTLDGCTIVTDPDLPEFVRYTVEDLRSYLQEITGAAPRVVTSWDDVADRAIVVGPQAAQRLLGPQPQAAQQSPDAYVLKSVARDGKHYLVAAGTGAPGTKYAVARLMKLIRARGNSAQVDGPIDIAARPSFARRGMHFNGWAFGYPYTFRGWREEDWQRYLDILSYQGVNLFYLWPFMEIMPVPLSASDQAYLEECRRVVDYAQQKHGMEVWIMQCTNRVASDRCGVDDPRQRPYWRRSQEDLNPGNPEHFAAIMASREALYRIVDNVDGVCNIDSDPGAFAGSPISDYLKVLRGCRDLLDVHNVHGKQTKLVNWMWYGWGVPARPFDPAVQKRTLEGLQRELREPWWLICGTFPYLSLCRDMGVLEKTVLLPYGVIELEPCYPTTNVQVDAVRKTFEDEVVKYPELAGVMGNVQTPLLQFPHVYFYTSTIWDLDYRGKSEKEVLTELGAMLYPEQSELVADCYLALKSAEPERAKALADQLDTLVHQNKLGRPGVFGRKLFPNYDIVARSLVLQLKLHAACESLLRLSTERVDGSQCASRLSAYADAYLAWDTAHGWHALWGWGAWPLGNLPADPRFGHMAAGVAATLGDAEAIEGCFAQVTKSLAGKYDERAIADGCVAPLKNPILAGAPIRSLAQQAVATASTTPNAERYPASAANDGLLSTLYWPGALVENNSQWLQLAWKSPQTFDTVIVHFLQHPSMHGRVIHLQQETADGVWEDVATTVVPSNAATPHAVATFKLPAPVSLDKIRIVNLLDLFEVDIH